MLLFLWQNGLLSSGHGKVSMALTKCKAVKNLTIMQLGGGSVVEELGERVGYVPFVDSAS